MGVHVDGPRDHQAAFGIVNGRSAPIDLADRSYHPIGDEHIGPYRPHRADDGAAGDH
jgi:hypothetical protein